MIGVGVDVAEENLNGNQSGSNAVIQPGGQLPLDGRALPAVIPESSRAESDAAIEEDGRLPVEVRALLAAIPGPHQAKKRRTVVRLAFARANEELLATVFEAADTCDARVWWQKWQYIPEVRAAHDGVLAHVLQALDSETASIEAHYRRLRRQAVARHASEAPAALAAVMDGASQKGSDRINAAVTLIKLAEPETAGSVGTVAALSMEQVAVMAQLSNDELLRVVMGENVETIRAGRGGVPGGSDAGAGGGDVGAAPAGSAPSGGGAEPV